MKIAYCLRDNSADGKSFSAAISKPHVFPSRGGCCTHTHSHRPVRMHVCVCRCCQSPCFGQLRQLSSCPSCRRPLPPFPGSLPRELNVLASKHSKHKTRNWGFNHVAEWMTCGMKWDNELFGWSVVSRLRRKILPGLIKNPTYIHAHIHVVTSTSLNIKWWYDGPTEASVYVNGLCRNSEAIANIYLCRLERRMLQLVLNLLGQ